MATISGRMPISAEHRFFLIASVVMACTIMLGFSMQLAMGRSSFSAPLHVHLHAVIFFGWTAFYVLQNALVATGSTALHRRLGWIGAGWAALLVPLGLYTTADLVRRGAAPFFFEPNFFLIMDCMTILAFGGLMAAGIALRRRTAWHRRLIFCAMTILTGPAFGRLLPMPLMIPWGAWGVFVFVMLFPAVGMIGELRRTGTIHRAWWWGVGTITVVQCLMGVVAYSAPGLAIYRTVTAGTPGASIPPLTFPPPPGG